MCPSIDNIYNATTAFLGLMLKYNFLRQNRRIKGVEILFKFLRNSVKYLKIGRKKEIHLVGIIIVEKCLLYKINFIFVHVPT